ncbi:hypothetical protein ACIQXV_20800 [Neobacillus sp. NPDC097160]|uniref:hypothetical protein n=1 Tax=Neobacillus sp. NPDC097160 TaxID=3364298 RepID=UPI0037F9EDF9
MTVKMISKWDGNGFLEVKDEHDILTKLPQYLKVDYTGTAKGRDNFTVLEGRVKGQKFSVDSQAAALGPVMSYDPPAVLQFHPGKNLLRIPHQVEYQAKTDEINPIPEGNHIIQVVDTIHKGGHDYPDAGPFRFSWFPIDEKENRYLHPGEESAGCVTVLDHTRWIDIYEYLIKRRKNDTCVSILQVCPPDAEDWCKLFNGKYQITVDGDAYAWGALNLEFSKGADNWLNVVGSTDNHRYGFSGAFALTKDAPVAHSFGPQGGSVMEGRLTDNQPSSHWPRECDLRVGCWEVNFKPGLMIPVQIQWKGTIAQGHWNQGAPHTLVLTALEQKKRPWYNYPWNYPNWSPYPPPLPV